MSISSSLVKYLGPIGGFYMCRILTRSHPKILMYHHFSIQGDKFSTGATNFRKQARYLAENFTTMTTSELVKRQSESPSKLNNVAIITVDDGYVDFYDIAFPILKEFGLTATFYVTTGFIAGDTWLWTDQLHWMFREKGASAEEIQLNEFYLPAARNDNRTWIERSYALNNHLLTLDDDEKWHALARIAENWKLVVPKDPVSEYQPCRLSQLKEMQDYGIEIGGHTVNHPILTNVSTELAYKEIRASLNYLNDNLGTMPRSFCYPNGNVEDYSPEIEHMVKDAGYTSAVVSYLEHSRVNNIWAIKRHNGSNDLFHFYKSLAGCQIIGAQIRDWLA